MRGYDIPTNSNVHNSVFGAEEIGIQGNVIPPQWLHHLKYESGKPYMIAAFILSDIVYWYRPVVLRDEISGQVLGYRKKFKADKLQRSYQSFADMYGFSKREVSAACHYLQKQGLIDLDLRTIKTTGLTANNVLYIGINPVNIKKITTDVRPITPERDRGNAETLDPPPPESDTNTETTTEDTTEGTQDAPPPAPITDPTPSDFELTQSAIKDACKIAISDNNKGQLLKATREAMNTGKTPEQIAKFGEWFNKTYWPGKWPNIGQISTDWPKFEAASTNGNGSKPKEREKIYSTVTGEWTGGYYE